MINYLDLQNFIDSMSEGVLLIDNKNNYIVNRRFKSIFDIVGEDKEALGEVIEKYKLLTFLNYEGYAESEIWVKGKKVTLESFCNHKSNIFKFDIILFKEVTEISEARNEIEELKFALSSLKDVLDNAYQGFVLVNEEGKIIKWNYEKLFGIKEEDALGKHVEDVIENTRLHIVLKTGKKELYDVQRIQGHDMIASRTPIIRNGKIIGAVGTVLFKDIKEVTDLAKRLKVLESTVDKYKSEISRMYCANYSFDNIITKNKHMLKLIDEAKKAANSNSTILIEGESGTGKEYFAHAIHEESSRRLAPFIRMFITGALPFLASLGVYFFLSKTHPINVTNNELIEKFNLCFNLSLLVILPAIVIFLLMALKMNVKVSMFFSLLTAILVSKFIQNMSFREIFKYMIFGYVNSDPDLSGIISGGGLVTMISVSFVILIASSYSGLFEGTGMLKDVQGLLIILSKKTGLYLTTLITGLVTCALCCNQTLPILLTHDLMGDIYKKNGLSKSHLAIDLENTVILVAELFPWSIAIGVPLATIGVGPKAIPYAVYLYLVPLLAPMGRKFLHRTSNTF